MKGHAHFLVDLVPCACADHAGDDYEWAVDSGFIEPSPASWIAFLQGYTADGAGCRRMQGGSYGVGGDSRVA